MEFTQEEADRHNALTDAASEIVRNETIIHGRPPPGLPGFFLRRKLKKAIRLYEQALAINPEGWSSMWVIGKIHQRLGDQKAAFSWFLKSHNINPTQPDVAREAGLAAMDSGLVQEAVQLCFSAVKLSPDDMGLQCNLALAYLLAGDDARANECARVAVASAPEDEIPKAALSFIRDVSEGKKKRPKMLSEVFPVC
jgi:tetratricopeptide (TPR) repeat protein